MRSKSRFLEMAVVSVAVSLLVLLINCDSALAERIKYLDVEVYIQKDSSVRIVESYDYDFEASNRYGFYRNMPLNYSGLGGNQSVDFHLLGVTNSAGDTLRSKVSAHDDAVTITVGDPRVAVSGRREYKIDYILRRGLNFSSGVPQFTWSVTGAECPVPIGRAVVRVWTNGRIPVSEITTKAYIGSPDNSGGVTVTNRNTHLQIMANDLNPGDDLTVSLGFPKGSIAPPSTFKNLVYWISDWWPVVLLPLFTGFSVFVIWWHYGRDAASKANIPAAWDPPTEMTPAEVGTLYDERCDMQDIVATLFDLARRGHLQITELLLPDGSSVVQSESVEYQFTKTEPTNDDPALKPYERNLLSSIFGSGAAEGSQRSLVQLHNNFYEKVPQLQEQIYESMSQEGYFFTNPDTVRKHCTGLAVFFCVFGMLIILASSNETTLVPFGIGVVISSAIIGAFAFAMPARTIKGVQALKRSQGFVNFINTAEARRIALIVNEDPEVFGRLLPYAMVLGVADKWADEFHAVLKEPPVWYTPARSANGDFSSSKFVVALGSGMRAMESTMLSVPPGAAPALDVTTGEL